jgi:hypothetical protein
VIGLQEEGLAVSTDGREREEVIGRQEEGLAVSTDARTELEFDLLTSWEKSFQSQDPQVLWLVLAHGWSEKEESPDPPEVGSVRATPRHSVKSRLGRCWAKRSAIQRFRSRHFLELSTEQSLAD